MTDILLLCGFAVLWFCVGYFSARSIWRPLSQEVIFGFKEGDIVILRNDSFMDRYTVISFEDVHGVPVAYVRDSKDHGRRFRVDMLEKIDSKPIFHNYDNDWMP